MISMWNLDYRYILKIGDYELMGIIGGYRIWFPFMLSKSYFKGVCHFQTDKPDAMLSHNFELVSHSELEKLVLAEGWHPESS